MNRQVYPTDLNYIRWALIAPEIDPAALREIVGAPPIMGEIPCQDAQKQTGEVHYIFKLNQGMTVGSSCLIFRTKSDDYL